MNINELSLEGLAKAQKDINARASVIRYQIYNDKIEANKIKLDNLRENKDLILLLFKHSRTSCSDTNISNGYVSDRGARCSKCHLIEILDGWWGNEFDVNFEISISKIEE